MVASALVSEKIDRGGRLIKKLDASSFPVTAAFWYYFPEAEHWRLVIASPMVDAKGRQAAYGEIHRIQRRAARLPLLSVGEITAVSPRDPLVKLLSSAIRTGSGLSGIAFSRNVVNGVYIEDAYIYRLSKAT